jgi:small subunit ribosomal protein S21
MSRNKIKTPGASITVGDLPLTVAMRKFKQLIEDNGTMEEVRSNMFYEKPTTERKRKKGAARARWLKKLREQELPKKLY